MKSLFLTNEYPPSTYGGAGVHVEYLSRELASLMQVDVRAFGNQFLDTPNLKVRGFPVDTSKLGCPKNLQSIFGAVKRCFDFNATGIDADVVHEMEDADLFLERRIGHRRRLQSVPQRFVVELDLAIAGSRRPLGRTVPVVDEVVKVFVHVISL